MRTHWIPDIECPTCGAPAGNPCQTLKTRRSTDTHLSRIDADFDRRSWQEFPPTREAAGTGERGDG